MGSESPCCGGGLSGISVLYSLHILMLNNPQIQNFPVFPKFKHSPPPHPPTNFYTLKAFEKSSKTSQKILELRTPT